MIEVVDRQLVLPGQKLGDQIRGDPAVWRDGEGAYSTLVGLARVSEDKVSIIPAKGSYTPKEDDLIVGVIEDMTRGNYFVSANTPYRTILPGEEVTRKPLDDDLKKYYNIGELVSAKIRMVDEVKTSILAKPWKLEGGLVVKVNPKRVPRIVGKKRSMLELLKSKTGSKIVVGQNGWIWIKDGNVKLAVDAVKKIEREAQSRGLTDRMTKFLDENRKSS